MKQIPRVAVVVSHPIQHFCPQYVSYASRQEWKIKVFFASALGSKAYTDKDFKQTVAWENLSLDEFDHEFLNNGQVLPANSRLDAPEIANCLNRFAPDAVVTYGYIQPFQRRAVRWAIQNEKKLLYIADSEFAHREFWAKKWLKWAILNRYFQKIDRFLTVGNHNEHYYHWFGVPLSKMIRMGFSLDVRAYTSAYDKRQELRETTRAALGISPDTTVFSVVGKLIPRKRQIDLIKALYSLEKNSSRSFAAILIGSGPQLELLKREAVGLQSNKAYFTGFVTPAQLPGYYAASDIYVHPSEAEPHSLAISEAIFMGCPVLVSSRCGSHGPTDDVQEGGNGFVYPCGDIEALCGHLKRLAENAALRAEFSENGRAFAVRCQQRAHGEGLKAALVSLGLL